MGVIRALSATALTVALLGCSEVIAGLLPEDAAESVVFAAIAGTWNATTFEFTNPADASQTFDVIANGGSLTLTITSEGQYSGAVVMPGETEQFGGSLQVQGSNLIMNENGEPNAPTTAAYTFTGDALTLRFDDAFDFDGDGTDEAASVEVILERT